MTTQRILFVDDDDLTRSAFERALASYGFDIDTADGHTRASALAAEHDYAIVATDFYMPEVNGLELVTRLRVLQPQASFILVTGHVDLELTLRAVNEHGVAAVITKPWNAADLAGKLLHLLEGRLSATKESDVEQIFSQARRDAEGHKRVFEEALRLVAEQGAAAGGLRERLRAIERELAGGVRTWFSKLSVLVDRMQDQDDARAQVVALSQSLAKPVAGPAAAEPHEQRRHTRVPMVAAVRIRGDDGVSLGQSEDVSVGGMFVATDTVKPLDTLFNIEFSLPSSAKVLHCRCRVAWLRPDSGTRGRHHRGPGMGLEFLELDDATRATLAEHTENWGSEEMGNLSRLFG